MTEIERILGALNGASGTSVLATLMSVAGSAYRAPGARMVVLPDDTTVGAISGGCLEKDVMAHAQRLRGAPVAETVSWDLTRDDDAPWGLNMGCNAKLDVLLEPCPNGPPHYLSAAASGLAARHPVVLSTAFVVRGSGSGMRVGDHALLIADGVPSGALAASPLAEPIRIDAQRIMHAEQSEIVRYTLGGEVLVLHEFLAPSIRVLVFGEGADVAPAVQLAVELGWQAAAVRKDEPLPAIDERTAAIIMTHNYARDVTLVAELLKSPVRYIGLLGGKARAARLLDDLEEGGLKPGRKELKRLHAPVGLDIGAETPEEIALAVLAEVRAAFSDRDGGMLRERKGTIHERR